MASSPTPTLAIDLHSHSTASDGLLSPTELVQRAAREGLAALALTDHDTLSGMAEAALAAQEHGVRLIPGVEVSALWESHTLHVLGLNVDPESEALQQALGEQGRLRSARGQAIAAKLRRLGFGAAADRALHLSGGASLGRAHFARALVDTRVAASEETAFRRLLRPGKPAYVSGGWLTLEKVIAAIHAAGGAAVLAHPMRYHISQTNFRRLVVRFASLGGQGLELGPARLKLEEIDAIVGASLRHGLGLSLGSDFHGPGHAIELGQTARLPPRVPVVWQDWGLFG